MEQYIYIKKPFDETKQILYCASCKRSMKCVRQEDKVHSKCMQCGTLIKVSKTGRATI